MIDGWVMCRGASTLGAGEKSGIHRFVAVIQKAVVLVAFAAIVGCGSDEPVDLDAEMTEDQINVNTVVSSISDSATDLGRLRENFTKEAAPKSSDLKDYANNYFSVDGDINVTGSTATFSVKVMNYESGAEKTANWKAVKEGDKWLLSEAPVP